MNDKPCWPLASMSDSSGSEFEEQQLLLQYLALFTFAAGIAALAYGLPLYDKTPYHTSALTGADWVYELGVHKHVFLGLVAALEQHGVTFSKDIYIEEQLAVSLYTCVTGLSLCHVSE